MWDSDNAKSLLAIMGKRVRASHRKIEWDFAEIVRVVLVILTDFKLYPAVIARALLSRTTFPRTIIPRHSLYCSDGAIQQFSYPTVHTRFTRNVIPVITVGIFHRHSSHSARSGALSLGWTYRLRLGLFAPVSCQRTPLICILPVPL